MKHRIVVEPFGIVAESSEEESLLQTLQKAGVKIAAYCNGNGVCGKCKIKVMEETLAGYGGIVSKMEHVTPLTETEKRVLTEQELQAGYRLACAVHAKQDVVIEVPRESYIGEQVILEEGIERTAGYHPAVKAYTITVDKPSLKDADDDWTRIKKVLLKQNQELKKTITIRPEALRHLGKALREGKWTITVYVLYGKEIIKVAPHEAKDYYGLAIDVGTTTVAVYLCNLKTGKQICSDSMMNPQIKYGDDVLTRVSYCVEQENGLEELNQTLWKELNQLVDEIAKRNGMQRENILEAVMVFNTVMEHIALQIPPDFIGRAPFTPAMTEAVDLWAKDLGFSIYSEANVHCLPIEAAFVGADNVAVLIAEEPYKQDKMKLIIDIGTNSEICLGNAKKMYSTSCATGPALEGAQIYCGMRAAEGGISKIVIDPNTLEPSYEIIQNTAYPIGICGSGIIDAVAQMALTGIIDANGRFTKKDLTKRIRKDEAGKKEYVLYFAQSEKERDIVVKQSDVRAVQLAKAALYAGAKALMKKMGIEKVDEVILAGGFGSYIDKENALKLGMYPDCKLEHVTVSGNAAGMGAKLALFDIEKREEAKRIADQIEFVETATQAEYQQEFVQAMAIPHNKDKFTENAG